MRSFSLRRARGCKFRKIASVGLPVTLLVGLAGCVSYSYVDAHNVRHVIGFNDVSSASGGGASSDSASDAISVTSIGLTAYSGPSNDGGLILGYSRQTFLSVANNACVDLSAPGLCTQDNRMLGNPLAISRILERDEKQTKSGANKQ